MIGDLIPSLPLLRRELTELANRRRTYVVRIVGAILILAAVLFRIVQSVSATGSYTAVQSLLGTGAPGAGGTMELLGIGGRIFEDIVPWLFRLIQILMPALCCGSITMEKERNTLGTLFLTRLSPTAIILEKLGSRLVPMFTFLLLTFPILAYVYSLGGVDTDLLLGTIWLLICECLLYASVSLMCSSWFTTTVSAFMGSYAIVAFLVLCSFALNGMTLTPFDIWRMYFISAGVGGMNTLFWPVYMLNWLVPLSSAVPPFVMLILWTVPSLIVSVVCLWLARFFLFRRAFVTSSSLVLRLFRVVDRFFVGLNQRTAGGIELVRDVDTLPEFDPIAWRERSRRSLGKARYLFRVLTLLEVPTFLVCAMVVGAGAAGGTSALFAMLLMMWVMAAMIIIVKASTAISGERARETLEALLSTPLSSREILTQKISGMNRLLVVLSVPILTIHATSFQLLHSFGGARTISEKLSLAGTGLVYGALVLSTTWLSMLLLAWFAAGCGMRFHSQSRSILVSVTAVAACFMLAQILRPLLSAAAGIYVFASGMGYTVSGGNAGSPGSLAVTHVPELMLPGGSVLLNESYLWATAGGDSKWLPNLKGVTPNQLQLYTLLLAVLGVATLGLAVSVVRWLVLRLAPAQLNRQDGMNPGSGSASERSGPNAGRLASVARLAVVLICVLLPGSAVAAQPVQIKVVETIWGFDGRTVPGQFNPLSILVDNLSSEPLEGRVTLRSRFGLIQDSGGLLSEPLYLSPNTRRWVQFYPYIGRVSGSWRIAVTTSEETVFSETIAQGRSVVDSESSQISYTVPSVILDRTGMAQRMPTSVKHMPAEIFPPYATAVSALRVLFLDHVPDWETPRQESLLSWLKMGGELHLLQDLNGQNLQFSGTLAALNEPFPEFTVGVGRVVRHSFQRDLLTDQIVKQVCEKSNASEEVPSDGNANVAAFPRSRELIDVFNDSGLPYGLRRLTQPEHAWWLILLLSLLYIGLIFPGCWIVSQNRQLHYMTTYGAITGLAAVFSILFLFIGRRGYDEASMIFSAGIARAEGAGHFHVLQWQSVFVTDGAQYQISSTDEQAMLSSGSNDEFVDGTIQSGNNAVFDVRIPPFSSQSLISRRRITVPDWNVSIRSIQTAGSEISSVELSLGSEFPVHPGCIYLLLHERRMYSLKLNKEHTALGEIKVLHPLREYVRGITHDAVQWQTQNSGFPAPPQSVGADESSAEKKTPEDLFYEGALPILVERSLVDDGVLCVADFRLPSDRIRLMVYAPVADGQQISFSGPAKKTGRLLYLKDLLLKDSVQ